MRLKTSAERTAEALLDQMRHTPMHRGAVSEQTRRIRADIARVLIAEGVLPPLARRVAFQLATKFRPRELESEDVRRAIGRLLHHEVAYLKQHAALGDARITAALPKLSAAQVVEFLDELTKADRRIARTILHAALNTADPLTAGRRYLAEYSLVARKLQAIDPAMARTIAAATFAAGAPLSKAMEHLERFSSLMTKHGERPEMARMIARAIYRAKQ